MVSRFNLWYFSLNLWKFGPSRPPQGQDTTTERLADRRGRRVRARGAVDFPHTPRDGLAKLLERPVRGGPGAVHAQRRTGSVAFAGMPGRCRRTAHNSQMWTTLHVQDERAETARHIETDSRRCETPKLVTQNQQLTGVKMPSLVGTPETLDSAPFGLLNAFTSGAANHP